jgi:hypothetical protein
MSTKEFEDLRGWLERAPTWLFEAAARLDGTSARRRGEGFAFVEQVWHLADLEREGYGVRIARLREEDRPQLPDFEGDRIARERRYIENDVDAGLTAFARARAANLAALSSVEDWARPGEQDGVGPLTLADVPRMMREHDRGHFVEIARLLGPDHEALTRLWQP